MGSRTTSGPPRQLAIGETFAGCRIESLAGRGEMGLVYRAYDLHTDGVVALKVIRPELARDGSLRARFARESLLATQIHHPHIIPVHRVGEEDGVQFMVMRFVEGVGLDELRRLYGRFAPGHAASLVTQIAGALDAVHAQGFVHRDVKPGNVLVTGAAPHEHLYLTDFGLAKRMGEGCDLTGIGGYVGTPDYIPPEQVSGDEVDARSDVYALGCLLYELLSGTVPFPRENHVLTIFAHLSFPVPLPSEDSPDIPVGFDRVIAGAMSKDPVERYGSAGDLARAATLAATARGDRPVLDGPVELASP
ncbi:MAG: serine/threonine-protein kinase [Solirubrobacteraceae bacterium]